MQAICARQNPEYLVNLGLAEKTTAHKTELPTDFLASLPENLQLVLAETIRSGVDGKHVSIQDYVPSFSIVDGKLRLKWLNSRGEYREMINDLAGVLRWLVELESTIESARVEVESWIAQKEEAQTRAVAARDLRAIRALTDSGCVYDNGPYCVSWYVSQEAKEIGYDLDRIEREAKYDAQEAARVAENERKRWAREKRLGFVSRVLAAMGDIERAARLDRGFLPMAEFNSLVHTVVLEDLHKRLVPDSAEFCACSDPVKLGERSFLTLQDFEVLEDVHDPWSQFFKVEVSVEMAYIDDEKGPIVRVTISDASGESDWYSADCYYL